MPHEPPAPSTGLDWRPHALEDALRPWTGPVEVEVVSRTGSTNSDLLDALRLEALRTAPLRSRTPRVLLAEWQTGGRGRMGRQWQAMPGASLTFSIGWALNPVHGWGALSLAVGLSVAQALQPWEGGRPVDGDGRLLLKWPNDLWWFDAPPTTPGQRAQGRKVAGILIETLPLPAASPAHTQPVAKPVGGEGGRWVVVGIGINVRAAQLPNLGGMQQATAGTSIWRPQDDAPALWHLVVPSVCRALLGFERDGFGPISAAAAQRDVLIGQAVTLSGGPASHGHCVGLDADGALLVVTPQGLQRVVAGEIQVRPDGRTSPDLPSTASAGTAPGLIDLTDTRPS